VLDGMYRCGADGLPSFIEACALSDDELHALLQTIITRLMKMLTRHHVLAVVDDHQRLAPRQGRDQAVFERGRARTRGVAQHQRRRRWPRWQPAAARR
jgi:hypothetical protein